MGDNAIREAYRTGYPVYAHNYDSEEDEENVLDKAIREDLLYAYYDSEEEDISEWIDGDFILGDRFFARSAYKEMDPTPAPAPKTTAAASAVPTATAVASEA